MLKIFKNTSISTQYLILALTLPIILFIITLTTSYLNFKESQKAKYHNYWHQADKVFEVMDNSFNYIFETFNSLDIDISNLNYGKSEAINKIFKRHFNHVSNAKISNKREKLLVRDFYFISPDGKVLAHNGHDTTKERPKISKEEHAFWMGQTTNNPDYFILTQAPIINNQVNSITKDIIPGVLGVTNQQNIFIGYLLAGIDVEELRLTIYKILGNPGIDFILIDNTKKAISLSNNNQKNSLNSFTKLFPDSYSLYTDAGFLEKPIKFANNEYNYFRELRPYPLTLLLGINSEEKASLLKRAILSNLLQALGTGIFLIWLLYFFRSRLINPLLILSNKALAISKGNIDIEIPIFSHSNEASHLANALLLVRNTFISEKLIKEDLEATKELLEKALNEVNETKRVKILFVSTLVNEIMAPLKFISANAQAKIILEEENQAVHNIWQKIFDTTDFIGNLVSDLQNYTESDEDQLFLTEKVIDLQKVFDNIIDILQIYINDQKVQLLISISDNAKYMTADELKVKQMLLNILNYLLNDSFPDDQIIIEIKIMKDLEISFLRTRSPTNKAFSESSNYQTHNFINNQDNASNSKNKIFSVSIARKLVELHGGILKLDHILDIGKIIKIEFPYSRIAFPK